MKVRIVTQAEQDLRATEPDLRPPFKSHIADLHEAGRLIAAGPLRDDKWFAPAGAVAYARTQFPRSVADVD
jgi:hypothetical protein